MRPHDLDEGQVGDALAVGEAGALEVPAPLAQEALLELVDQPALAEPGLAHHGDDLALALFGQRPAGEELLELEVAPDEAREAALGLDVKSAPEGAASDQLVRRRGGLAPLDHDRADRAPIEGRTSDAV